MQETTKHIMGIPGVIALNLKTTVNCAEPFQADHEPDPDPTPWKTRLYGVNKDRRASRKKRAKKLARRR